MKYKKLNNLDDTYGLCHKSDVQLIPSQLIETFGNPLTSDEYKVSGEYVFKNKKDGTIFTLYDWKYTSLYDSSGLTPDKFWKLEKPVWFNIGGKCYPGDFESWIKKQIKKTINKRSN
jgi:hypothetical protein